MSKEQFEPLQHDFNIWYKSKKESFLYINERSRVFPRWLTTEGILNNNNILKPINLYAKKLYPGPSLLSLKNPIILQQKTHAEIFLLDNDREFYNLDRPWIRQYYLSDQDYILPENCFPGIFRFYIPWVIDDNVVVKIKQADSSPFFIYEKEITFNKIDSNIKKIDPQFIHFHFKKEGSHMIDQSFSKIPRQSPMYNIEFLGNDIIGERVREYYEQH